MKELKQYWLDILFFIVFSLVIAKETVNHCLGRGSEQYGGLAIFALIYLLFLVLNPRSFLRVWLARLSQRL